MDNLDVETDPLTDKDADGDFWEGSQWKPFVVLQRLPASTILNDMHKPHEPSVFPSFQSRLIRTGTSQNISMQSSSGSGFGKNFDPKHVKLELDVTIPVVPISTETTVEQSCSIEPATSTRRSLRHKVGTVNISTKWETCFSRKCIHCEQSKHQLNTSASSNSSRDANDVDPSTTNTLRRKKLRVGHKCGRKPGRKTKLETSERPTTRRRFAKLLQKRSIDKHNSLCDCWLHRSSNRRKRLTPNQALELILNTRDCRSQMDILSLSPQPVVELVRIDAPALDLNGSKLRFAGENSIRPSTRLRKSREITSAKPPKNGRSL